MPKWRNWQTRCVQGAVGAILWGFNSPLRQKNFIIPLFLIFPLCSLISAGYHTYEQSRDELFVLNSLFPNIAKVESIGYSTRDSLTIWGIKISDFPHMFEDEPSVLFVGCIHAEELVGVEIVHYAIEKLLHGYGLDPILTQFVDNLQIYFIPILNPEGHKVVTDSLDITFRKNKRDNNGNGIFDFTPGDGGDIDGVDLNRNFPFNWEYGDSNWISSSYRGPSPGSEAETQALMSLAQKYRFVEALFYHSSSSGRYNEWVIYPWIWNGSYRSPDYPVISDIARTLASQLFSIRGGTYQAWYSISRNGNANDWLYSQIGTISFTVEVDTTTQPEPERLGSVCENQWNGILYILDRARRSGVFIYVVDSLTLMPIEAQIVLLSIDDTLIAPRYSDSIYGVYRRLLLPGNYTFIISKHFFKDETLNVNVSTERITVDTVYLKPVIPNIQTTSTETNEIYLFTNGKRICFNLSNMGARVSIFDILGQEIFQDEIIVERYCLPIEPHSGLYLLRFESNKEAYIKKLIIFH